MFRLNGIARQGTINSPAIAVRYATLEEARVGARELLRDDRILRMMIVWNEIPPRFAEWVER
jgi:hypothetical protein